MKLSALPSLRSTLLNDMAKGLTTTALNQFRQDMLPIYGKQQAIYPTSPLGFRYQGKVYTDQLLVAKPAYAYQRLHETLIEEFEELLERNRNMDTRLTRIKSTIADALTLSMYPADVFCLLPASLRQFVHSQTVQRLINETEPQLTSEAIEAFKESHAQELQWIKKQMVLNIIKG